MPGSDSGTSRRPLVFNRQRHVILTRNSQSEKQFDVDNETDAENQKSTTSPSSEPPVRSKAEFAALNAVLIALEDVEKNEDRERVLLAAAAFFGIHLGGRASQAAP